MSTDSKALLGKIDPRKLPDCVLCHDKGLSLGYGPFAYQFCSCAEGVKLREETPDAASVAEAVRQKVLGIGR